MVFCGPQGSGISIHALLTESDPPVREIIQWEGIFLSTLSLRRATYVSYNQYNNTNHFYPRSPYGERRCARCHCWGLNEISIHALLTESDVFSFRFSIFDFLFLSTLSLRRATLGGRAPQPPQGISIHALLTESDG